MKFIFALFLLLGINIYGVCGDAYWIMSVNKNITKQKAKEISRNIYITAFEKQIDPILIFKIIKKESRFNDKALNKASNASGLMQIIPRYHKDKIKDKNIFDIKNNIEVGVEIFSILLKNKKTIPLALNSYAGVINNQNNYYKQVMKINIPDIN